MANVLTFLLLFITWVIFSGQFDLFHLTLGLISCFIVTLLSSSLLLRETKKPIFSRTCEACRFVWYTIWLLIQVIVANLHVVGLALTLKKAEDVLDPHIFTFRTKLQNPFARYILANSITLTPGTVTVRTEEELFFVHAISRKAAGDLFENDAASEMEHRIAWVFEPENPIARGPSKG